MNFSDVDYMNYNDGQISRFMFLFLKIFDYNL